MLTFTAVAETSVTITLAEFVQDAQQSYALAYDALLTSEAIERDAAAAATYVPADWRSAGGADAATIVRFISDDADSVSRNLTGAAQHLRDAANADTARDAAEAEHMAGIYARAARYDVETMRRYLTYLTDAAAILAPCYAARTGEGYWTCDVPGGCADCRDLAAEIDDLGVFA